MSEKITTYKGMSKDMTAHGGFQYELGKTYTDDGAIRCKSKGFHSCDAPMDVLRYFPIRDGNRYFVCEAAGIIDRTDADDTKLASSELTVKGEIGLPGLVKAQVAYTRRQAEAGQKVSNDSNLAASDRSNLAAGYRSNLAAGDWSALAAGYGSNLAAGNDSNLAASDRSNLAAGNDSNLAGGNRSNLAAGDWSALAAGYGSNLAASDWSTLAAGYRSNLAAGNRSTLAAGNRSTLAAGYGSNLAAGYGSVIAGRNGCAAKAGKNSVIVLTEWEYMKGEYNPVNVKAVIVDGEKIKADTWYTLKNGELVEVE